jgi:hypothetical protein
VREIGASGVNSITLKLENDGPRHCGGCTLCCKLLPVVDLNKKAGERCAHQRSGKGCAIYHTSRMPMSCVYWTCRWLTGDDTAELRRPDRSRYVVDVMPDYVTHVDGETGERLNVEVVQIWCDPKARDAWRDPALLDYIERRGNEGKAAIVRFNQREAVIVFPPALSADDKWHFVEDSKIDPTPHDFLQVARAITEEK